MKRYPAVLLFCISFANGLAQSKLTVQIDPRLEAISIFFFLATADTFEVGDQPTPSVYYAAVKNYFKKHLHHPSLEWYRKLPAWDGFDIASFGIYLSNSIPFRISDSIENRYIRSTTPALFLKKLNRFCIDANMQAFLTRHQAYFKQLTAL